jgi:hypothetical protein
MNRGIDLSFLDLGTRRGGWSTPRPGRFTPRERLGTHCTGGWVDPRAGLNVCEKSRPHRNFLFYFWFYGSIYICILLHMSIIFCRYYIIVSLSGIPLPCTPMTSPLYQWFPLTFILAFVSDSCLLIYFPHLLLVGSVLLVLFC